MSRRQLGDDVGVAAMARLSARRSASVSALRARRKALREILACGLVATGALASTTVYAASASMSARGKHRINLPEASDLQRDAAASERDRIPILLFFDRGDCPYCERALREYLVPMSRDEKWRGRAIYRQVEVDRELPLIDFDGTRTTHGAFAARYRAVLTPTVMVVDGRGQKIGDALIGLITPDFYAAYLENAIDAAVKQLRG